MLNRTAGCHCTAQRKHVQPLMWRICGEQRTLLFRFLHGVQATVVIRPLLAGTFAGADAGDRVLSAGERASS